MTSKLYCTTIMAAVVACLLAASAFAYDSEWPPEVDPYNDSMNPPSSGAGSELYMGEISVQIPSEYAEWFAHMHHNGSTVATYGTATSIAFGDLEGVDDGDLDVVLYKAGEAALAARLNINWTNKTATMDVLWFWLTDFAASSSGLDNDPDTLHDDDQYGDAKGIAHSDYVPPCSPWNVLVWNVDQDSSEDNINEVVLIGKRWYNSGIGNGYKWDNTVYILRTDPSPSSSPWGYSDPSPLVYQGSDVPEVLAYAETEPPRLSTCKVRDTSYPQDFWFHDHRGENIRIWKFENNTSTEIYAAYIFGGSAPTIDATGHKTHEFNCADVDDDGFDEFFLNGCIDFVDAGGPTNTTNPMRGKALWQSNYTSGGHHDEMWAADWDTTNSGLEVLALCEGNLPIPSEFDCDSTSPYETMKDVLYDADDGTILAVNCDAPSDHGEDGYVGNWTSTETGLEAIMCPKDFYGTVTPPNQVTRSGAYTVNSDFDELAMDGILWASQGPSYPNPAEAPIRRSTGPAWYIRAIDWDGDYSQDEIFSAPWDTKIIWRMGEKGDWGATMPSNFPPQTGTYAVGDSNEDVYDSVTDDYWWCHYYQGSNGDHLSGSQNGDWSWNNGGAGRYTHYFEKLAEVFPHASDARATPLPYDVTGDHREELVVVASPNDNTSYINIFYNVDTYSGGAKPSPRHNLKYRRWRMDWLTYPFLYADLPTVTSLEIRPDDDALPTTVVGMDWNDTLQLKAIAHFSDGSSVDVTHAVAWMPDALPYVNVYVTMGATGLVTSANVSNIAVSANVHAVLPMGAGSVTSNDLYVYASDSVVPSVLTAGYEESYILLDDGVNEDDMLHVTARVAQKDNAALDVIMINPSGYAWVPYGGTFYIFLMDNGNMTSYGDAVAGDGIYSALVPYAANPTITQPLVSGDNLKTIRACRQSDTYPTNASVAWPYHVEGSSWSWTDISGQYNTDAYDPDDMPVVVNCGVRGAKVLSDWLFIEAEVLEPVNASSVLHSVWTAHPVTGTPILLSSLGGGKYGTSVAFSPAIADGTYVLTVQALALKNGTTWVYSDAWPRARVHVPQP